MLHGLSVPRARRRRLRLLALLGAAALLFVLIDIQLRPLIQSYGVNQAKWASGKAVNEAVTQVLADTDLQYKDLVSVGKNETGEIVSVEANISKINQLKAAISSAVLDKMKEYEHLRMGIPLGTILGWDLLTGRGPRIPIQISVSGSALTTMRSDFYAAGINQTTHKISMDIRSALFVAIPGYNTSVEVSTSFVIAETVLVGKVPDSFTNVNGDTQDMVGKIFDYTR